jgi:hypothetical protein
LAILWRIRPTLSEDQPCVDLGTGWLFTTICPYLPPSGLSIGLFAEELKGVCENRGICLACPRLEAAYRSSGDLAPGPVVAHKSNAVGRRYIYIYINSLRQRPEKRTGVGLSPRGLGQKEPNVALLARRVASSEGQSGMEADPGQEAKRGRDVGKVGKDGCRRARADPPLLGLLGQLLFDPFVRRLQLILSRP